MRILFIDAYKIWPNFRTGNLAMWSLTLKRQKVSVLYQHPPVCEICQYVCELYTIILPDKHTNTQTRRPHSRPKRIPCSYPFSRKVFFKMNNANTQNQDKKGHFSGMGLLPDTLNRVLRMPRECRERFPRHRSSAIPPCITARAWRTCRNACRDR